MYEAQRLFGALTQAENHELYTMLTDGFNALYKLSGFLLAYETDDTLNSRMLADVLATEHDISILTNDLTRVFLARAR